MSDSNEHDPQPAPLNEGEDVIAGLARWMLTQGENIDIATLLLQRRQFGVEKYGQPLMSNDGRDSLKDLEDEILDALAYSHKIILAGEVIPSSKWRRLHRMVRALEFQFANMMNQEDE